MVICQYFLKGACTFGDRCFNEHRRPENRGSYNQGSRNQRNYQQDSRDFNSAGRYGNNSGRNSGGGRYNQNAGYDDTNYDSYNQGYRNQKNYHDNRGGGYRDTGRDGYGGSGSDSYSGQKGGGQNYSRDKYHYDARDKNRFSALSHQPDPEPPSFHENRSQQSRDRAHSTTSQHSVTLSLDQKVDRVRKDMSEWHESGQWSLSCYAPFVNEPCFDGLVDVSPEEMRSEAYKANSGGNAAKYAQTLQQTMDKHRRRKQELATMSSSQLQDEISRSSQPSSAVPGGLFGNLTSSPQSLGETSLFGESSESMATSSTGLLGPSLQSMHTSGPFTSGPFTSSNPTTTPSTFFGSSSSAFGSTQVNNTPSSTSMFCEDNSSGAQTSTDGARSTTMTSLRCSEEDLKAFRAAHFVLGAVPECPPPLELC